MKPVFEVFKNKKGEWGFRLKAVNAEIVLQSEGYKQKQSAVDTINVIKKTAPIADIKEV